MNGASWRDRIKVHPAADLFPLMPDAELDKLSRDIAENQLQQGVVLWTPDILRGRKVPKEIFLLDGRNRLEAIERIFKDDPERRAEAIKNALNIDGQQGCANLLYADYTDPFAYVVSANIHRRHLAGEQRRDLIAALLKAKPERSDRETAKIVNADHKTVAAVRAKAEANGEIPHKPAGRTEATGRKARGRKPKSRRVQQTREQKAAAKETKEQATQAIQHHREQREAALTSLVDFLLAQAIDQEQLLLLLRVAQRDLTLLPEANRKKRLAEASATPSPPATPAPAPPPPAQEPAAEEASPGLKRLLDAR